MNIRLLASARLMTSRALLCAMTLAIPAMLPVKEIKAMSNDGQAETAKPAPQANPADVKSLDSILAALYDVISGPAGKKRDWDRFRSLFVPGARLVAVAKHPDGVFEARVMEAEGYVTRVTPLFEKQGFHEHEISRKVDSFGQMTHVFSTYETRHSPDDKTPLARGINSIQLLNDGHRWWIVTIYWDSERADNQLPAQYLPSSK